MSYYGQAGDYYQAGGLFDVLKGVGKAALGFVTGGPVGAVTAVLPKSQPAQRPSGLVMPSSIPTLTAGSGSPAAPRGYTVGPDGLIRKKRRRMNFTNSKALTRANRRMDGFVRVARRTLKHTNYKLVTKGSTRRKSAPATIIETGPGSVRAG